MPNPADRDNGRWPLGRDGVGGSCRPHRIKNAW
jgi:hypothetical protein